jgi:hypothetical protein
MQASFAVDVFGVFRAVALCGRFGDCDRDARTFVVPELIEFGAQARCAFRGYIL